MHLAAGQEGSKTLKFLLETGKETPNQICNTIDRASPLHFAVIAGNKSNMQILLKNGAAVNAKDNVGNTALHMAVAQQSLPMVRILDKYGADGRIKNIDDISALDMAISEDIRDIKLFMMGRS